VRKSGETDPARFRNILREELAGIFKPQKSIRALYPPEVVMVIGVNGVGKTTTSPSWPQGPASGQKGAHRAGDTFRAAAIEQLKIWADRVGASSRQGRKRRSGGRGLRGHGQGPFRGLRHHVPDTDGRLHTKANLMEELKKIKRVLGKKHPCAPHRSVLVLDATTGQNACPRQNSSTRPWTWTRSS
jgi:fused signal recognition particle receptor